MIRVHLNGSTFTVTDCGVTRVTMPAKRHEVNLEPGHYRITRLDDLGLKFRVFVDDLSPDMASNAGGVAVGSGWDFDGVVLPLGALGPNVREVFTCAPNMPLYVRPRVQSALTVVLSVLP
jgi:hypothetical protein